jgi:hypothetical protein
MALLSLDNELLTKICGYVDDVDAVRLTCKTLKTAVDAGTTGLDFAGDENPNDPVCDIFATCHFPRLHTVTYNAQPNYPEQSPVLLSWHAVSKQLKHLQFVGCILPAEIFEKLASLEWPCLETLFLNGVSVESSSGVDDFLRTCRRTLKSFEYEYIDFPDQVPQADMDMLEAATNVALPALEKSSMTVLTPDVGRLLAANWSNLKELHIHITFDAALGFANHAMPHLEVLDIYQRGVACCWDHKRETIVAIASAVGTMWPALRELCMLFDDCNEARFLDALKHGHALEILCFKDNATVSISSARALNAATKAAREGRLESLKQLMFRKKFKRGISYTHPQEIDAMLDLLRAPWPNVRDVQFDLLDSLNETQARHIIETVVRFPRLEKLSMCAYVDKMHPAIAALDDAFLHFIEQRSCVLPSVTELQFLVRGRVHAREHDEALRALPYVFPNLQKLKIIGHVTMVQYHRLMHAMSLQKIECIVIVDD